MVGAKRYPFIPAENPPRLVVSRPVPQESKIGFYLVMLAMLFEFGRPQDFFPFLKVIPFPTLLDTSLALAVFTSGKASFSNIQTKLWMGLLVVMALWVPFANNNFHALMTFKDMTLYFFFYLGIITFVNTTERMQKVILVWLGVHSVLAINGMLHSGRGIGGWLGDENDFGMEMNVAVAFAFFLYQGTKQARGKVLYLAMLGLFVLSSIATFSRGGFIGLIVVGTFCWLYSPMKVRSLVLVACVVVLVLVAAPQEYWDRINTITDENTTEQGTAGQRMFTWGIAWEMFLANPIFGIGQANFPWTIGEYMGGRTWQTKSLAGRQAHSLYFTVLPELGLVGALLFLGMVYFNYKDVRLCSVIGERQRMTQNKNNEQDSHAFDEFTWSGNAMLGALVGYLVTSTFISTFYYPTFWILMGLIVALRNTTTRLAGASQEMPPVPIRPIVSRYAHGARHRLT